MSMQSSIFPESIEDVLTAVQETPRGRWFLEAYAKRIKSDSTSNILQAIAKLENNMKSMAGADATLLLQTRNAIAVAKREISVMEPKYSQLSAEGQLFAKLADLSRNSFTGDVGVGRGIDRVLKLVVDLDRELSGVKNDNDIAVPTKPAIQYFRQDEEIFEPAPAPILKAIAQPEPSLETPHRGAKLVIQRVGMPKSDEEAAPRLEPEAIATTSKIEEKSSEPSRIVIIRRKAEDMMDVPLLDQNEMDAISAA